MKLILPSIILLFLLNTSFEVQSSKSWKTYFELHDFDKTPRYDETIEFSRRLGQASSHVHFTSFGTSHQGRELPLLILDLKGNFTAQAVKNSGNKIILIQAAIHAGEPDGKDAGLQLFRDIAIEGKYHQYLSDITILFIPILNPDGHERFGAFNRINQNGPQEAGWRSNAQNLNLNRDYLKADSKEINSFLKLWNQWLPDFYIDSHSTNGGDYQYTMTYAMGIYGDAYTPLVNWIKNDYLPLIEENMLKEGYPLFPYVTYRSWHDPRSGLISGVGHPMYSNSYVSELNRPGLLLETHMLKPYKDRVESTYLMMLHTIKMLHKDSKLQQIIKQGDQYTASNDFKARPFPLRFENTPDSVMVDFLGVVYNIVKSDLSGGNWFQYNSEKPMTYQIPWFNKHRVTQEINLPDAYIVPVEYSDIIERLKAHGIEMQLLESDTVVEVQSYRFTNIKLSPRSTEGRQTATFDTENLLENRRYHKGSAVIPVQQARARLIIHALEPMAPGSFAYWGFFNSIFERTEYFESYAMERIAREMMEEDPMLRERFHHAQKQNPALVDNPSAILNWFYEQSPWYDQKHNIYPVGKIIN
jgi:hypothetical protein